MQRESKNPPIEFRPRISIHHKACPELWDVFNKIPEERRTTTVMVMLTRLATMDVHGGPVIADASQQSFEELGRASSSGNHAVPSRLLKYCWRTQKMTALRVPHPLPGSK
ncbi:hypothetical protein [Acidovorax sp. FHTAMBA]|jgi:hypothetical protein|uniref:hypothetical protein n=1 Tax=Acidovorax sp. FHTAMBA TaxID=3140252 RepID=UPI0031834A42